MTAKKILIFLPIFYFSVLVQQSFLPNFTIKGVAPHLLLLLVFLHTFFSEQKDEAVLVAFLAGFFLDIFSELPLGFFAFLFALLVTLFQIFARLFEKSDAALLVSFISFFAGYKILLLAMFIFGGQPSFAVVPLIVEVSLNLLILLVLVGFKKCLEARRI